MHFSVKPIGLVHVNLSDEEVKAKWLEGVEGVIEIYEDYAHGLEGIDGFSHLIIIAYLHKSLEEQRRVLKVKPKCLKLLGVDITRLPEVGVFSTDSPHRPNPLALTIVELVEREGRYLKVKHLDLFNGTPILDIKPYTPSRRIDRIKLPLWYQKILEEVKAKHPLLKDF
ncbi:MAG: tRNA (N6-threonylcarbamoyladenosine(37)-N6)-methyltransferase TrmO [Candidatus Terraquivivens tikiterensis]|uniref:tRNA (N6-threonylcarbamoyladenosine(37)-N6)-methyltransferase TrmO n=1 Tax=Candidatus Terraquivivens tikiterensis TaxID=1980982 RepID=A0A2R7Y1A5_9ARCH|nr:MAG: tRNA (N6-threonylcarbamoyladenosine(37)-N6)-methyltransferase TrmO [Candidatus Terraquivivens tikiterensis]